MMIINIVGANPLRKLIKECNDVDKNQNCFDENRDRVEFC